MRQVNVRKQIEQIQWKPRNAEYNGYANEQTISASHASAALHFTVSQRVGCHTADLDAITKLTVDARICGRHDQDGQQILDK